MARAKLKEENGNGNGGSYFTSPKDHIQFVPTGATTLDCVIGGGWALGRIGNIVGDKSTGKTLLAIEAMANFAVEYPSGHRWYCEVEAAFDEDYAKALGMPDVEFVPEVYTVEDFFEDLEEKIDICQKEDVPAIYVLDSLDALSDKDELDREIDKGSYGTAKAKKMSEIFRKLIQKIEHTKILVLIISQVRDNLNAAAFGKQTKRSGGRALDFYASQVIYLAHLKALTKTKNGIKRTVGVQIKCKCEKNKIGLPFRDCEFPILFGYGIDDFKANIEWLIANKKTDSAGLTESAAKDLAKKASGMSDEDYFETNDELADAVKTSWKEIEDSFLPTRKKYA